MNERKLVRKLAQIAKHAGPFGTVIVLGYNTYPIKNR